MRADTPTVFRQHYYKAFPIDEIQRPDYQREEIPQFIRAMAADFTAAAYGALLLASEGRAADAAKNVLDGTQRLGLAKAVGISHVPVLVQRGLSYERQAQIFAKIDHRKKLTAFDVLRASRESRDEKALDFIARTTQEGFAIMGSGEALLVAGDPPVPKRTRRLLAIKALREIHTLDPEAFSQMLRVFAKWDDKSRPTGEFIQGLGEFVAYELKDYREDAFVANLRKTNGRKINEHLADKRQGSRGGKYNVPDVVATFREIADGSFFVQTTIETDLTAQLRTKGNGAAAEQPSALRR